jgi:hypothetical protein
MTVLLTCLAYQEESVFVASRSPTSRKSSGECQLHATLSHLVHNPISARNLKYTMSCGPCRYVLHAYIDLQGLEHGLPHNTNATQLWLVANLPEEASGLLFSTP